MEYPIPAGWRQIQGGYTRKGDKAWDVEKKGFDRLKVEEEGEEVAGYYCLIRKQKE